MKKKFFHSKKKKFFTTQNVNYFIILGKNIEFSLRKLIITKGTLTIFKGKGDKKLHRRGRGKFKIASEISKLQKFDKTKSKIKNIKNYCGN